MIRRTDPVIPNSLPLPTNSTTMEQKFENNSIDIEALREFCEREGKETT